MASLTTTALAAGVHSLTATFTGAGFDPSTSAPVSQTVSAPTPPPTTPPATPPAPTPLSLGTPAVTGSARVDSPVTCAVTASGATGMTFAWKRDGAAIAGATSQVRAPVGADLGRMLSCSVTATGTGGPKTTTSTATKVALGVAPRATTKPKVTGVAKVGRKLTAKLGVWSPAATSYDTTWLRDGNKIKGATKRTYLLTKADKGHKVTVKVRAKKTYHLTGTSTAIAVRVR